MTIRKTLLSAFLLVGLVPAIVLAGLAFVKAREAMQAEIDHALVVQADAVASDINQILFERLQNAATWSALDVTQDLQVQDVDKRLSNFLAKLKSGYGGIYLQMHALGKNGKIISSSDPLAIGHAFKAPQTWQNASLAGTPLTLGLPERTLSGTSLAIRAPIASQFSNEQLGELILEYNWGQIDAILDRAASNRRMIALVDTQGHVFAASRSLRAAGLLNGTDLSSWQLGSRPTGAFTHSGAPAWGSAVLVGLGRPQTFSGFPGLGLSTLVIQPLNEALAPIHRTIIISLAILIILMVVTLGVAGWISSAIARPIVALTAFTKKYQHGSRPALVTLPAAGGEVGELGRAFVQMMHDIEQSQDKLIRASKLAAVGEMSSAIAHEVRTPLGILRSSAQILRRDTGLSVESHELIGFIESETERLNRLVSTMLDSARPRELNRVPTDLQQLVHQSGALLAAQIDKHHIHLSEQFGAADAVVECDAEQMTQVLLNLILNSVQILAEGGQIRLTTHDTADQFFIEISDDGPGIPVAERSRIFEAFFFRREGGIGLGLAIVQQIIANHGGDIEVGESELGGARFVIRLPRKIRPDKKD